MGVKCHLIDPVVVRSEERHICRECHLLVNNIKGHARIIWFVMLRTAVELSLELLLLQNDVNCPRCREEANKDEEDKEEGKATALYAETAMGEEAQAPVALTTGTKTTATIVTLAVLSWNIIFLQVSGIPAKAREEIIGFWGICAVSSAKDEVNRG